MLWDDVKLKLAYMQRVEHFHRCRERKEKERFSFCRNPFRFAQQLLEEKKKWETTQGRD